MRTLAAPTITTDRPLEHCPICHAGPPELSSVTATDGSRECRCRRCGSEFRTVPRPRPRKVEAGR